MTEITRWAVQVEGDIQRIAGGMLMTFVWNHKKDAAFYAKRTGVGKPVKVTIRVEK